MNVLRRGVWAGSLLLLAGCQTLPEYTPPAGGPTALVRFTTAGAKVGTTVFDDARCSNPREIGTHERFVAVPAGREVFVQRGWYGESTAGTIRHSFTVAFTVEAGRRYELQYGQGYPTSFLSLLELDAEGRWIPAQPPMADPLSGAPIAWRVQPLRRFNCPARTAS
ncbi:hypothetical protein [uncultured Methylibium sp.]|uniref:hypothetical protein n=1 Tax=uncultured Methylibium sp. TaxID=381093 RepID=UPI0025FF41EC|nr:hypothetical protein [uncultured Methylibium sp.]